MMKRSSNEEAPAGRRRTGIWWGYVAGAVVLVMVLVLVVQNDQDVRFEWLWVDVEAPLALILLATVVLTAVLTSLIGFVWRSRRRAARSRVGRAGGKSVTPGPQSRDPQGTAARTRA